MTTPAGWRIRNAETAAATAPGYVAGTALQAIFHPGASTSSEFLIRLRDQSGRSEYLVGCKGPAGTATSYNAAGTVPTALVYLDPLSTILSTNQTGGLGGVAPDQTVRVAHPPPQAAIVLAVDQFAKRQKFDQRRLDILEIPAAPAAREIQQFALSPGNGVRIRWEPLL